jgi:hypothetical protein
MWDGRACDGAQDGLWGHVGLYVLIPMDLLAMKLDEA